MRGLLSFLCVLLLCVSGLSTRAAAEQRLAFVVGIDNYDNLDKPLLKARNDAKSIAATFKGLGFEVALGLDLNQEQLLDAWEQFLGKLGPGDVVSVFFAGHGVQLSGQNYLLPKDILGVAKGEEVLKGRSIGLSKMLDDLADKKVRVALMIIDACRDNPFKKVGTRSIGGSRGLWPLEPRPHDSSHGTFVMYSAGAGELALDRMSDADQNPNSVYTRRLLPLLSTELSLLEIAKRVQSEVEQDAKAIDHPQTPAYYDGISGLFALKGAATKNANAPFVAPQVPVTTSSSRSEPAPAAPAHEARPKRAGVRDLIDPSVLPDDPPDYTPQHGVMTDDPTTKPRPLITP